MTPDVITSLASHAMYITLLVASPLLASALVIGLVVSLFQAATQINEMTLSFIPKILGVFAVLVAAGPWLLETLLDFTRSVFTGFPQLIG
ncbi:flagellar biosynthesis protein FliQ [Cobetia marina]|uniref:Flagellar biosynthetic protein FliQ n=1 Tax=Cobetia marina TaxID=28258 RepID=A0ABU9GAB5_COBMA|nr:MULTISPECIES: flagellar biosynthesis protein FliQ [Cobetia]AOM01367.1 EscS/YscS/HrcS family type III secretion system export apparatus protein [Cobetia marina]AZV31290.1 flagellar biosynthetic protein FliQ [Cobetia sp. ICG0124]MDH2373667.1 flagellar biosynthesis protein FliQ [Cobetia sp. 3AK]MDI6003567.1 flagellar biosynthesis protein FliQ [Cobetia pacifica]MDN2656011.1 flagellar biosynthesis protein FliQ [Cobetia sp. 14N.309.X.WAT.E.A4]